MPIVFVILVVIFDSRSSLGLVRLRVKKASEELNGIFESLLKKVAETPEWKDYVARTAQTGRVLVGADLTKFIDEDYARFQGVFKEQGWLVQ